MGKGAELLAEGRGRGGVGGGVQKGVRGGKRGELSTQTAD